MSDEPNAPRQPPHDAEPSDAELAALDSVGALVARALAKPSSESAGDPRSTDALVEAVQTTLRVRSGGKFYGDGWSTGRRRRPYVLVALAMLLTALGVYLLLGPIGVDHR